MFFEYVNKALYDKMNDCCFYCMSFMQLLKVDSELYAYGTFDEPSVVAVETPCEADYVPVTVSHKQRLVR